MERKREERRERENCYTLDIDYFRLRKIRELSREHRTSPGLHLKAAAVVDPTRTVPEAEHTKNALVLFLFF